MHGKTGMKIAATRPTAAPRAARRWQQSEYVLFGQSRNAPRFQISRSHSRLLGLYCLLGTRRKPPHIFPYLREWELLETAGAMDSPKKGRL